jgi:RNA polymerase sigma factor (sigma-70 family)
LNEERCVVPTGDDAIQARFAAGDERALEECQGRYGPLLLAYTRRYVGHDDAEDVVQKVMIEAWKGRGRYDPSRPLEAWLLAIARRRSIDLLRTRKTRVVGFDALRELSGDDGRESAERFAWAYDVRRALDELPEVQREALVLAYFGGLSQAEVAVKVGAPLGTIKTRMARGMQRLADLLGTEGFE